MERFEVGQVVLVLFPFSNLKGQKLRPALVLAQAEFGNIILCQITSKEYSSKIAIKLTRDEFEEGGLPMTSFIRPDKLFTAETAIVQKVAGSLTTRKKVEVLSMVRRLFANNLS